MARVCVAGGSRLLYVLSRCRARWASGINSPIFDLVPCSLAHPWPRWIEGYIRDGAVLDRLLGEQRRQPLSIICAQDLIDAMLHRADIHARTDVLAHRKAAGTGVIVRLPKWVS